MIEAGIVDEARVAPEQVRRGILRRRAIPILVVLAVLTWGLVAWRALLPPVDVPVPVVDLQDMVLCPAGTLRRATPPGSSLVGSFYIDRFEVTRFDYAAFLAANPRHPLPPDPLWGGARTPRPAHADLPVTHVTLHDARAYATWRGKRLPTSVEWEWAARGPQGLRFPWGDASPLSTLANTLDAGYGRITPVGLFESGKSSVGTYDMVGNVEEWTVTRTPGLFADRYFVRGGSFLDPIVDKGFARSGTTSIMDTHVPAERLGDETSSRWEPIADRVAGPDSYASDRGFRCVRDAEEVAVAVRVNELVAALGARDPVTWYRRTKPAIEGLRAIGFEAVPALRHAARHVEDGGVRSRIERLAAELESAAARRSDADLRWDR